MFATNVGTVDRIIRVIVGVGLLAFALMGPADIGWKWVGYIGVIPLLTAIFSTCPLYSLLGMSSCPVKQA